MANRSSEFVASLQVWRELERLAREAEASLNKKLVAYFRGESAAPTPDDLALAKHAREVANRHFGKALGKPAPRQNRPSH